jgi:hypothetical protein
MSRNDKLDELHAKIKAGTMTYEDTADLFMRTMVGQFSGVSREEILAKTRARFQDTAALNGYLQYAFAQYEAMVGRR